jgi:hypothetical protein
MARTNKALTIRQAAEMLGLALEDRFPDIVGVSLHPSGDPANGLQIFVDINKDYKSVPPGVPNMYRGFRVRHRWVTVPTLAAAQFGYLINSDRNL